MKSKLFQFPGVADVVTHGKMIPTTISPIKLGLLEHRMPIEPPMRKRIIYVK
jgi:hypothetical protein